MKLKSSARESRHSSECNSEEAGAGSRSRLHERVWQQRQQDGASPPLLRGTPP